MKKTIKDINLEGKNVVIRVDFNVPLWEGKLMDDFRITSEAPTIKYCLDRGAKRIVILSHLGRPKGFEEAMSLFPVKERFEKIIGKKVIFIKGPIENSTISNLPQEGLVLMDNLRFNPGEVKNEPSFSKILASMGDIYIMDAFSVAHRKHASVYGVKNYAKEIVAGFLMMEELEFARRVNENLEHPAVAVLGGKKISDKLTAIFYLQEKFDHILLGGGLPFTIMKAHGENIGLSPFEEDLLNRVKDVDIKKVKIPVDFVSAKDIKSKKTEIIKRDNIPSNVGCFDIGPNTVEEYLKFFYKAKTIIWAGPLGVYEEEQFSHGSLELGEGLENVRDAYIAAGGGDTVSMVRKLKFDKFFTHLSTGGGASLKVLEGEKLPGITVIEDL